MPMQPGSPQAQIPAGEDALIRRIQELERTVREILPSVATSFGPVVADLQAQLAAIALLVGAQTVPATDTAGSGTVSVAPTTTPTDYAVVTFTVPTGFTKAQVFGVSAVRYAGEIQRVSTVINSVEGEYQSGNTSEGNLTSSNTATLTGLSGGGTFTVTSRVHTASGTGVAYPLTSAQVTFYR